MYVSGNLIGCLMKVSSTYSCQSLQRNYHFILVDGTEESFQFSPIIKNRDYFPISLEMAV